MLVKKIDMNELLIINNVGPINHVEIKLNKINVIIGAQSSGKSSIAKIVSFCQWLEKSIIINQGTQHVDSDFIRIQLIAYHGFDNYFSDDSYISYESDFIKFEFHSIEDFSVKIKGSVQEGLMTKVAYIPSERVFVSIPNLSTLNLENKYTRAFIFDWLGLRSKYNSNNHLGILDLGVEFYFDPNFGEVLSLQNGKNIRLAEASSGLQALVPMLVYVDYVTKWIYSNEDDISYDKYSSVYKILLEQILSESSEEKIKDLDIDEALGSDKIRKQLASILQLMQRTQFPSRFSNLLDRILKYHSTKLTIEEGEMNVFPTTQYNLVKYLISSMDFRRGDSLFLTTHSPYIMTSINNLIQAGNASKEDGADLVAIDSVIPKECWIDYADVSAWAISDGLVESINDDEFRIISADALDSASEVISSDFSKLL